MAKALIVCGAIINFIFGLFHLWLGWNIRHLTGISEGVRGLLLALNSGGTLFIFFFAYTSAFLREEMLTTRTGRAVLGACALLYLSRAAEEFFWFKFNPVIFGACAVVGVIYGILVFCVRTEAMEHPRAMGHVA